MSPPLEIDKQSLDFLRVIGGWDISRVFCIFGCSGALDLVEIGLIRLLLFSDFKVCLGRSGLFGVVDGDKGRAEFSFE